MAFARYHLSQLNIVLLTFNEEQNLSPCLASLQPLGCPIYAVDSGSTDGTLPLLAEAGVTVLAHPFETHSRQWKWALENLPLTADWILALDSDQALTPELQSELKAMLAGGTEDAALAGLYVNRRQIWRGKWIRHGGYYPKYLLKLFRKSKVFFDEKDFVDHHFYVTGPTDKLNGDLIEKNVKEDEILFWTSKHNRYAGLMAKEEWERGGRTVSHAAGVSFWGSPDQRILWAKGVWYRLPLYVRPFIYFLYRYFLRLGILDGKVGFLFHFLQGFWFRLLVDVCLEERRRDARQTGGRAEPELAGARSAK